MNHKPGGIRRIAEKTVRSHFLAKMDEKTLQALEDAHWDLHNGPSGDSSRMGYTTALKILRDWSSEELTDVYYDIQGAEVLESEPDVEEYIADDYIMFDVPAVRRLLFGALISDGGM